MELWNSYIIWGGGDPWWTWGSDSFFQESFEVYWPTLWFRVPTKWLCILIRGGDYNLKFGFLQNNDLRGTSLKDIFIRLSSYRVRHWTMMTFVYHSGEWYKLSRLSCYRVRHWTMMTFVYHSGEWYKLSWFRNNGESNAIEADPKPNKQANLQNGSVPNPTAIMIRTTSV